MGTSTDIYCSTWNQNLSYVAIWLTVKKLFSNCTCSSHCGGCAHLCSFAACHLCRNCTLCKLFRCVWREQGAPLNRSGKLKKKKPTEQQQNPLYEVNKIKKNHNENQHTSSLVNSHHLNLNTSLKSWFCWYLTWHAGTASVAIGICRLHWCD